MSVTWLAAPVDKSFSASAAWTDVDCSAQIPATATGVILYKRETINSQLDVGFRKNGSTDDRKLDCKGTSVSGVFIGVDGSQIFEAYQESTDQMELFLLGYFTDDAVFKTNAVQKTGSLNAWVDRDISGDTGGDTAIAAIFEFHKGGGGGTFGARKNGSTDDRITAAKRHLWGVIGVDASEIFEAKMSLDALYLVGYITKESSWNTNAPDESLGSTGAWTNLTTLAATATGAVYEVDHTAGGSINHGFRPDGNTDAPQTLGTSIERGCWQASRAISQIVEGQISDLNVNFYETGWFLPAAASGWTGKIDGVTDPAKIDGIAVANIAKVNNVA